LGEEKSFLKNYTIPFVQLETLKTILVFSHDHNSFDKKTLLDTPNEYVKESQYRVEDFVKQPEILNFFLCDIDELLKKYKPGDPKNKKDVIAYMNTVKKIREEATDQMKKREIMIQQDANKHITNMRAHFEMTIAKLTKENVQMKDKIEYLEKKISELIKVSIQTKKANNMSH
jgi:hypothetical protein